MGDGRHGREELDRLVHLHLQHVTDALAAPAHAQGLGVEALAVALVAGHLHIGQEAHLDGLHALALAARAAALAGVEAEAARRIAPRLALQRLGKEFADGVPEADVGGRAGARRLADGGLVDLQHAVDLGMAFDAVATRPRGGRLAQRHGHRHIGQQHIARERGLARPGHAGHRHQPVQRHVHRHTLQVVQRGVQHGQPGPVRVDGAAGLQRVDQRPGQHAAGGGVLHRGQLRRRALGHHAAAALAGAGADVDDVVGAADGVLVMLDHHQGVAPVAQGGQRLQQDLVVARVQADGGLVQHIADALQIAAELGRQPDALGLAARQRR
mmetsp:Transcript_21568/g.83913  ORF Transcript_21568/g.83913 Transcript_21568/m.83913 type:complete len:326 (+) Transcript_21568:1061-2038(+)